MSVFSLEGKTKQSNTKQTQLIGSISIYFHVFKGLSLVFAFENAVHKYWIFSTITETEVPKRLKTYAVNFYYLSQINLFLSSTFQEKKNKRNKTARVSIYAEVWSFMYLYLCTRLFFAIIYVLFGVQKWGSFVPRRILKQKIFNYSVDWICSWKYGLRNSVILDILYNKYSPIYKHHIWISAVKKKKNVQICTGSLDVFLSV